jgi:hypothetical protein
MQSFRKATLFPNLTISFSGVVFQPIFLNFTFVFQSTLCTIFIRVSKAAGLVYCKLHYVNTQTHTHAHVLFFRTNLALPRGLSLSLVFSLTLTLDLSLPRRKYLFSSNSFLCMAKTDSF